MKIYYAVIDKVILLQYLNVGKSGMYRLKNLSIITSPFKSDSILYTDKEIKYLKIMHPEAEFISKEGMYYYIMEHKALIQRLKYEKMVINKVYSDAKLLKIKQSNHDVLN